jgi:hypothetical protein
VLASVLRDECSYLAEGLAFSSAENLTNLCPQRGSCCENFIAYDAHIRPVFVARDVPAVQHTFIEELEVPSSSFSSGPATFENISRQTVEILS